MTDDYSGPGPATNEAEPVTTRTPGNGAGPRKPKRPTDSPVPGISIPELIEERNWTALAGLGLIGVGLLYVLQNALNIRLNLWSLLLVGVGGWLIADAWRAFDTAGRTWPENTRNRLLGGALIALVGLVGMMDFGWWGLMLLVIAGWLGYDSWQRYETAGRVWNGNTRNRMIGAGVIGATGLVGFLNLGAAWPLLLIITGGVMLYRRTNRRNGG